MGPLIVNTAAMAELVARMAPAGARHHLPMIRAAVAGELDFAIVPPGARLPLRLLDPAKNPRPFAVILGDDGAAPCGPSGFPQARRLLKWARALVIHATGGEEAHYAEAAVATRALNRVVVVETTTAREGEWGALAVYVAPGTPTLRISVPVGGLAHPGIAAQVGETVH